MNKNEMARAVDGGADGSTRVFRDAVSIKHRVPNNGLSTDHPSHPPAASGQSAGKFNPSDLPTTPVPGGHQDRPVRRRFRTPSLPALRVAVGLLVAFLAVPSLRAHAQNPPWVEVWSATMTVGLDVSSRTDPDVTFATYGYVPDSGANALGSVTNDSFKLNGMDYAVSHLAYWTRSSSALSPAHHQLNIVVGNELPTGAIFDLGGTQFPVTSNSRYYNAMPGRHEWGHPGLNWSDGNEVVVRLLVPVITAEIVDAPGFHDGSSAFRARVRFSKVLQNNAEEVARAFAAETTGGMVTEAQCVSRGGSSGQEAEEWDIYFVPDGSGAVTLRLPAGGQCHLSTQLCSKDELRVGNWLHEVRAGAWIEAWTDKTIPFLTHGVTATVVDAPDWYDGTNTFDVRIRFNAELRNSYLKVMRAFEGTTGGTVVRTRPVESRIGIRDGTLWDITVQPDGDGGDVTLALKTGGPCWGFGQPCSKGWKWITDARDFPLTISTYQNETIGRRASVRPSPSWTMRAGRR